MELRRQHSNGGNNMSYHHLTTFERGRIQELLAQGYSNRRIAKRLGRHHSCIDREVRRNGGLSSELWWRSSPADVSSTSQQSQAQREIYTYVDWNNYRLPAKNLVTRADCAYGNDRADQLQNDIPMVVCRYSSKGNCEQSASQRQAQKSGQAQYFLYGGIHIEASFDCEDERNLWTLGTG